MPEPTTDVKPTDSDNAAGDVIASADGVLKAIAGLESIAARIALAVQSIEVERDKAIGEIRKIVAAAAEPKWPKPRPPEWERNQPDW